MTRRPSRRWCRGWSATRWRCWRRSPSWSWTMSRPRRWRCWRWWPAKTLSRASGQGLADGPAGRQRSGHLHRGPAGAPCPQDQRAPARWLQGPHRRRARVGLVTECALTAANVARRAHRDRVAGHRAAGLEVLGDSAYGGGETRAALRVPATSRRSSRSRYRARCPAGSPSTTSTSTTRPAWSGARRAPVPITNSVGPASPAPAPPARCAGDAPPPRRAARSTSTPTRTSCALPAAARPPAASSKAIGAGGRWWNAHWPGWSPMAAGGCPTAGSSERPVVVAAGRRGQPAPAAGAWPCPSGPDLGAGLTGLGTPGSLRLARPPPAPRPANYRTTA